MNINGDVHVNTQNPRHREYQIYSGLQAALQPHLLPSYEMYQSLTGRRRNYVSLNSCVGYLMHINLVDSDYKFLKGHFYFLLKDVEPRRDYTEATDPQPGL